MKTLGMIGGVGPESTIDYYKNIIAMFRERKPDGHYPQFVINSIDLQKGIDFLEANDLAGMAKFLWNEIENFRAPAPTSESSPRTHRTSCLTILRRSCRFHSSVLSKQPATMPKRGISRGSPFLERATPCSRIFIRRFS